MISYYGSKGKIAHLYPKPLFSTIVEPFCGMAKYSIIHFEKDVYLIDAYEPLIKMWHWLQQCSPNDILSLPKFKKGDSIKGIEWDCEGQAIFMGFMMGRGLASPQYKVSPFVASEKQYHFDYTYKRVAADLFKIKHWIIKLGTYTDIVNHKATWFIDPPYQFGGKYYKHKNIDYSFLNKWSMERDGQIIVCENSKADWMQFETLRKMQGSLHKTVECMYTKHSLI